MGEVRTDLAHAVHESLVRGGHRLGAGGAGGLVGEVGEVAEVVDGGAEGSECGAGGLGGGGERESGAAAGGREPAGVVGGGPVAEGVLPGQVAQENGQMTYFVVQDLAQSGIQADLVGQREVVGHTAQPVGQVVQQRPLVEIGRLKTGQRQLWDGRGQEGATFALRAAGYSRASAVRRARLRVGGTAGWGRPAWRGGS